MFSAKYRNESLLAANFVDKHMSNVLGSKLTGTEAHETSLIHKRKTDVTPAIFSRDFVARENRARKSQV